MQPRFSPSWLRRPRARASPAPAWRSRLGVLFAIVMMVVSGLAIYKPVQLGWITWALGGFAFARIVHFFFMCAIVAFLVVHIALVALVPKTLVAMTLGRATHR